MSNMASLIVRFGSVGYAQVKQEMSDLRKEGTAAVKALEAERDAIKRTATERAQFNEQIKATRGEMQGATSAMRSNLETMAYATIVFNAASQAVMTLARAYASAVQEAAKWEKYQVALTTMEGSAVAAERALSDLYAIAKAPGIDLEGANKSYLQLRAIGIEGERAKNIISQFANTVARSGGGGVEFERVNRQLVQMLANGRVLESELKWMKESMPELAKLMQQTFGTTSAEGIRNLGISAEEFVDKLTVAMSELPRAQETLTTAIENTHTAWSKLKASFVDTDAVKSSLNALTSIMEKIVDLKAGAKRGEQEQSYKSSAYLESDKTLGAVMYGQQSARDRMIIQSMQNMGMTGSLRTNNPLTGFALEDKTREDKAEREAQKANSPEELERKRKAAEKAKQAEDKRLREIAAAERAALAEHREILRSKEDSDKAYLASKKAIHEEGWKQAEEDEQAFQDGLKRRAEAQKLYDQTRLAEQELALQKLEQDRVSVISGLEADGQTKLQIEADFQRKRQQIIEEFAAKEKKVEDDKKKAIQEEAKSRREALTSMVMNTSGAFDAMAALTIQYNEKNTRGYAAWVAASKSLAIVSATISVYAGMADALRSGATITEKMAGVATVAAAGGQIIGAITAMNAAKVGKGAFARGGTLGNGEWGIAGEAGAEIVEGPARIHSATQTNRMLAGKSVAPVVNVYNNAPGVQVETRRGSNGEIEILVAAAVEAAERRIAANISTGVGPVPTALTGAYRLRRGQG